MSSTLSPRLAPPNILRIEIDVGPGPVGAHGQRPLSRAGLLIVNPPHALFDEARLLMPWLAALLARDGRGAHRVRMAHAAEIDRLPDGNAFVYR